VILATLLMVVAPAPRGSLEVEASEPGAELFLDGRDLGQVTPAVVEDLLPGEYAVTVRKGNRFGEGLVEVRPDQRVGLHLRLSRRANLSVDSTPPGAEVRVDGFARGTAPLELQSLSDGPLEVVATLRGYRATRLTVSAEETAAHLELEREAWAVTWSLVWPQFELSHRFTDDLWWGGRLSGAELGIAPLQCGFEVGVYGAATVLLHKRFDEPQDGWGLELYAGPSVAYASHVANNSACTYQNDPFLGAVLGTAGRFGPLEAHVEVRSGLFGGKFGFFIVPSLALRHTFG